jgi:carboxylesterase type B
MINERPVLVLIHGGFFSIGSARKFSNFEYIGEKLVTRGIVVVALQYRLGFLGL